MNLYMRYKIYIFPPVKIPPNSKLYTYFIIRDKIPFIKNKLAYGKWLN